jgi:hypothetical protein
MRLPFVLVCCLAACSSGGRTVPGTNHPAVQVHRPTATACAPTTGDAMGSDQCLTDADCPNGGVCSCAGSTFEYAKATRNLCVPADCHVDADCGPGGACSPTVSSDCGAFYGVQGYYCHTADDTCTVDSECVQNGTQGYCAYAPETGHWACAYGFCAG